MKPCINFGSSNLLILSPIYYYNTTTILLYNSYHPLLYSQQHLHSYVLLSRKHNKILSEFGRKMGSEYKEKSSENGGGKVEGEVKVVEAATESEMRMRYVGLGLRVVGLMLTLIAATIAGVDKESKIIPVTLSDSMPPMHIHIFAKFHYMSSLVYFVVINSIACSYAAISLTLSTIYAGGRKKHNITLMLMILDLIIVALLFSANGAAAGVGLISRNGNSHVHWDKVCNLFDYYCGHMFASLVISLLGSFAFIGLVVLTAWNLHKKL